MLPFFILFTPEKLFNILIINIKSLKITNLPFNYFIDELYDNRHLFNIEELIYTFLSS